MTGATLAMLFTRVLHGAILLALAGLALCVFCQVAMRYLLSAPPFWTEELARFLLIWITFIGTVSVQMTRDHIGVTWLSDRLPPRPRAVLEAMKSAVVLLVLLFIAKAGFDIACTGTQLSPALGISMRFVYGTLPAGAVLACIVLAVQLREELRRAVNGPRKGVRNGD